MTPFGSSIWTLATGVPVIAPGRFSVCVPPEGRKKFHEAFDAAVSVTVTVTVEGEDEDTAAPALEAFFKEHL